MPSRIISFIVNSNLWIATCAACMVWQTYLLLGLPIQFDALVSLAFFSTLFIYLLQRFNSSAVVDLSTDNMLAWMRRNRKMVVGMMAISALAIFVSFLLLDFRSQIVFFFLGIAAVLYSLNLFAPFQFHFRLRDIGLIKTLIVALVWAGCTATLPVTFQQATIETIEIFFLTFERFLFFLAITLPFDVRDLHYDSGGKTTPTLPMLFGIKRVKRISMVVLIVFMLLTSYHYGSLAGTGKLYLVMAFIISGTATMVGLVKVKDRLPERFYTLLLDGTIILQFLMVALVTFFFS